MSLASSSYTDRCAVVMIPPAAKSLEQLQQYSNIPNSLPNIPYTFIGEGAVDQGGPRREFFRLLALGAADRYFIGKDTMKFMDTNVTAL